MIPARCDDTSEDCEVEGMAALCPPQREEGVECSERELIKDVGRFSPDPPRLVALDNCDPFYDPENDIPF